MKKILYWLKKYTTSYRINCDEENKASIEQELSVSGANEIRSGK